MAFALQSSNMGRIFQTLGADPTKLGFFFILPPLAGMIVQPLVGYFSDRTWIPKIGRRLPYLIIGTIVAVVVMCLLPNSGSFGFKTSTALWFGAISILFMDLSSNMSMQPFKMMISDMVNDEQKDIAWSWQTIWGKYGVPEDGMTMEQYMDKFKVPFVIWANYPLTGEKPGITSLNFLAQYVLRDAGIQTSAFGSYLWNLTKTIPAMTFAGYFDSEGNAYSHLETTEMTDLIRQYQTVQYNELFGGTDRQSSLFAAPVS